MKKLFSKIVFAVASFAGVAVAQQDPQFTQFMYNKLIYNPGYAGTSGGICGVLQYRKQWMNFDGAPTTMAFAADMRLKTLPLGVGITVMSDKIGPMNTFFARIAGSYNIAKIAGGTLGIGVDVGILQKSISSNWIVPEPLKNDTRIPGSGGNIPGTTDPSFNNPALNKTTFDVGLGAFYQIPGKFYVGLSSTHLPAQQIKDGSLGYAVSRHYYMMAGYTFQPTKWSKITPSVLYKTDMASSSLDANLTFLWSDMIWVGGTYRLNDAPALLVGYQNVFGEGNSYTYKIGYSYDFTNSNLQTYAKGSHEFILGICYIPKVKKPTRYQNDRFLE
ncbi:MAG: type IX secretion system membrane protein PorP/SprF [bacterium]|nr:type IX secretion system membrane protein PorP/SprF [bacterium]